MVSDSTPFKGPKGKLPWIEHEGATLGDSSFIIEHLGRRYGHDLDASFDPALRACGQAFKRLLEENLYWVMVYDRWVVPTNWERFEPEVFGLIPSFARPLIGPLARRNVWKELRGHGIGLHSREEIHRLGCRDILAVADFLGDKPFLLGERPSEVDASAYGLLANILEAPIESPVKDAGAKRENLLAYCRRMRETWFAKAPSASRP